MLEYLVRDKVFFPIFNEKSPCLRIEDIDRTGSALGKPSFLFLQGDIVKGLGPIWMKFFRFGEEPRMVDTYIFLAVLT